MREKLRMQRGQRNRFLSPVKQNTGLNDNSNSVFFLLLCLPFSFSFPFLPLLFNVLLEYSIIKKRVALNNRCFDVITKIGGLMWNHLGQNPLFSGPTTVELPLHQFTAFTIFEYEIIEK